MGSTEPVWTLQCSRLVERVSRYTVGYLPVVSGTMDKNRLTSQSAWKQAFKIVLSLDLKIVPCPITLAKMWAKIVLFRLSGS
jgi:hypothetical protein